MKRTATIICLLITIVMSAGAQSFGGRSIGSQLRGVRTEEREAGMPAAAPMKRTYIENRDLRTSDRWSADTVCYADVERVNGWLKGVGPKLTKKQIASGGPYFRLTRHTHADNYLRVEAVGMQTAPSQMRNELMKDIDGYDYDAEAVTVARNTLKGDSDICRVDFTPSADGTLVLMEKAYDSEGNLCHTMTLERIDDKRAVAFYYCPLADELTLTDSNRYTAPTGLVFEYTEEGRIEKLTPIDATGWPILKR